MRNTLTQETLKRMLHYDQITGLFTWKIHRQWNSKIGDVAGYRNNDGYICIKIKNTLYYAHILAVLYMEGYTPECTVDHKDRMPWNNCYTNLREASNQCNMRNRTKNKNNTSGVSGVSWVTRDNKWWATIKLNTVVKGLGYYTDFDDAVCARLAGEQCLEWGDCSNNTTAYEYVKDNIQ